MQAFEKIVKLLAKRLHTNKFIDKLTKIWKEGLNLMANLTNNAQILWIVIKYSTSSKST